MFFIRLPAAPGYTCKSVKVLALKSYVQQVRTGYLSEVVAGRSMIAISLKKMLGRDSDSIDDRHMI